MPIEDPLALDNLIAEVEEDIFIGNTLFEGSEDSSSSSSEQPSIMSKKVTINGVEIEIEDTPVKADPMSNVLYPREHRDKLSEEKLQDFFQHIYKPTSDKFENPSVEFDSEEKLQDSYDVIAQINRLKSALTSVDMLDVFTVIKYEDGKESDLTNLTQINLLENFPSVTVEEVARSNKWYRTMPKGNQKKWIAQNLTVTGICIQNNTDEELLNLVLDEYQEFKEVERGGPLLFKLIIDQIQMTTELAIDHLIMLIKSIRITEYQGENVSTVASLIKGAVKRIKNYNTGDSTSGSSTMSKLPSDINQHLAKTTFQSTSVPEFNEMFAKLVTEHNLHVHSRSKMGSKLPDIDALLHLAVSTYNTLSHTSEWTGITTAGKSAFVGQPSNQEGKKTEQSCFNCGKLGCKLDTCPRPRNEALIAANRKKYFDQKKQCKANNKGNGNTNINKKGNQGDGKKKDPPSTGKWRAPTEDEKKNKMLNHFIFQKVKIYFFCESRIACDSLFSEDVSES